MNLCRITAVFRALRNLSSLLESRHAKQLALRKATKPIDLSPPTWNRSLDYPTEFYLDCFRYFHQKSPNWLTEHRKYFCARNRGFGEDAFHTMWKLLIEEFNPRQFLEIGVYRGQTLSLVALLQKKLGCRENVTGISPFLAIGDSVSQYPKGLDYYSDTLQNFAHFELQPPELVRANSTSAMAVERIREQRWEMIYIDGNHEYEVVRQDWSNCQAALSPDGIIVLDDAALYTGFENPPFATKGHPGPSRLAEEIDRSLFREILRVGHNRVFQKIRV
jgi:hypothetical protein